MKKELKNKQKSLKLTTFGFTLIELLAVIVILAIIALIATPIVLNIIDDAKKESDLRSGEFYLKGLELSIAQATLKGQNITDGVYNIMLNGNVCLETYDSDKKECKDRDGNPNNNELIVEVKGKVPSLGTIVIENGQIVEKLSTDESKKTELVINEQTIVMKDGELKYPEAAQTKEKTLEDICTLASDSKKTGYEAGAKYLCEVKPGTSYTFYVLTTPETNDTTINLIMDRNINSDGTPTTKAIKEEDKDSNDGIYNLVAYNESGDAANAGPVTAMNYLNEATSSWENIENLNLTYEDEGKNFTGFVLNGKARLPYLSEVANSNGSNEYLYENLDGSQWSGAEGKRPTNNISGINGYWTLSSRAGYSDRAWYVDYHGFVDFISVDNSSCYGARPVINLKI